MSFFHLNHESFLDAEFPIGGQTEEAQIFEEEVPEEISILPLKNTVLFPGVVIPITVGRDKSIHLVKDAYKTEQRQIGVVTQRTFNIENPQPEDLYESGTIARILKMIKMPDGSVTIVIQGRNRFKIDGYTKDEPYMIARVHKLKDIYPKQDQSRAIMYNLKKEASKIIDLAPNIPSEAKIALENIDSLGFLVNFITANLNLEVAEKQVILEHDNLLEKCELVLQHLLRELQVLELSEEIQIKVKTDLDKQQREYILRQQIRAIQDELGEDVYESEIEAFRARAKNKRWPVEVNRVFEKELNRFSRLSPNMPDYSMLINYLEWLLELPWQTYSEDSFDFVKATKILDEEHYGLEKVKERILEHLAVIKLKADKKGPILCFYGPPGVGKTSLGKSIAKALDKEFIRISLGGMNDEAEIRGHRRTYLGALPGRIIQGFKKAKTSNPVFMLDEIDKLSSDYRGDPASALLEVLDPEQNHTFRDNFLEVEYDLSKVMFIATANNLWPIHPALRDRMEMIQLNSYSLEEKEAIAKKYIIPKTRKDHGLKAGQLIISDKAVRKAIERYTREAGVRNLNQQISAICRVSAKKIVLGHKEKIKVTQKNLSDFLGIETYENEQYERMQVPGVAIGLAWTSVGGEILFIEATLTKGNGRLSQTGRLGEVMRESTTLAYTYLQANSVKFGIPYEAFKNWDLHLHIPAGAIPKDGPSAGITILSTLASIYSQRLLKPSLAMTGEITLRGNVLPVGGIKEKVLAAARAGIKSIILPKDNEKDIKEIKDEYIKDLTITYISRMEELNKVALEDKTIPNPLQIIPVKEKNKNEEEKKPGASEENPNPKEDASSMK